MASETETTVKLNYEDLSEIAEAMNNQLLDKDKLSQGYLEWLLCDAIRTIKNVDFFEEQHTNIVEEMSRNLSMREYDAT